jgi:hypothetical protein
MGTGSVEMWFCGDISRCRLCLSPFSGGRAQRPWKKTASMRSGTDHEMTTRLRSGRVDHSFVRILPKLLNSEG